MIMPTDGNIIYRGVTERDGKIRHIITIDERTFQIIARDVEQAIHIALQAHLN